MGAELPAARVAIDPETYLQGRPIRSGEDTADRARGFRGLSSGTNWVYATRVAALSSYALPEGGAFWSLTSTSFESGPSMSIHIGQDVVDVKLTINMTQAIARMTTELGTSATVSTTVRDTASVTHTLTSSAGGVAWVRVDVKALVYEMTIEEVRLVVGDLPY